MGGHGQMDGIIKKQQETIPNMVNLHFKPWTWSKTEPQQVSVQNLYRHMTFLVYNLIWQIHR